MNAKLTLSLDAKVIASAKRISKNKGVSLSRLIENYLRDISTSKRKKDKSIVDELAGILGPVPQDFDFKKDIQNRIHGKHLIR